MSSLPECKRCGIYVHGGPCYCERCGSIENVVHLKDRNQALEDRNKVLEKAIDKIMHMGGDCPAEMPEAAFYRAQFYDAVATAAMAKCRSGQDETY